jgi:hypothetical protein
VGLPLTVRDPPVVGGLVGSHVTSTSHSLEFALNWNPSLHSGDSPQPPAEVNEPLTSTPVTVTTTPDGRGCALQASVKQAS